MSSRQIEMVWRCSSCGHRNLGRHKLCQQCGNPKDDSEAYEMPGDTAAAETVTAPELLRIAQSGPNWRCGYCGSHQRRFDGACAQCGAAQEHGQGVPVGPPSPGSNAARLAAPRPGPAGSSTRVKVGAGLAALLTSGLGCCGFGSWLAGTSTADGPKTHYVARVTARSWERVVTVERFRFVTQEAFAENIPADAQEQTALGQRHHHDDQVPDGFDTEYYTERVQDGYDTEYYTERVACGEDCVDTPESCHEVCSPNGNGFATCTTECSGGGRSCSTRYCDESRTRQVPRYRDDPRTRQVPRFRTVPRTAEWYSFRVWRWGVARVVRAEGQGDSAPRWPADDEIQLNQGLAEGEREREVRSETFVVTLYAGAREFVTRPNDEASFARLAFGSEHFVRAPPGSGFIIEGSASGASR
ncbi:MAG: hypothetical protein R3B40_16080 [Polyangiales bacterium]